MHLGADDCGIANVNRFSGVPDGFHPEDIYPDFRSVVVFIKCPSKGLHAVSPRICYLHTADVNVFELDRIACQASIDIEQLGGWSVPLPADSPYDFYDTQTLTGRGLLSMRHAVKPAGLGSLGKNTMLIHEKYGNMVKIDALLTNLDLTLDTLSRDLCIPQCRLCVDACPQHAIDGVTVDQSLCRPHTMDVIMQGDTMYTTAIGAALSARGVLALRKAHATGAQSLRINKSIAMHTTNEVSTWHRFGLKLPICCPIPIYQAIYRHKSL